MECPHLADFDKLTTSPNLRTILTTTRNGSKIPPQQSQQQQLTQSRGTRSSKGGLTPLHQCQGKAHVFIY